MSKYHDKGEQDRSNGKYNPPHGVVDTLTTWTKSGNEKNTQDNKEYEGGWRNTDNQIKDKK